MAELEDGIRDLHEQLNKFPVNDPQNVSKLLIRYAILQALGIRHNCCINCAIM